MRGSQQKSANDSIQSSNSFGQKKKFSSEELLDSSILDNHKIRVKKFFTEFNHSLVG